MFMVNEEGRGGLGGPTCRNMDLKRLFWVECKIKRLLEC